MFSKRSIAGALAGVFMLPAALLWAQTESLQTR